MDEQDAPRPTTAEALPDPVPHAGARYSLLRLGVLLVVGLGLYAAGLRGLPLIVLAFLVSGLVSYFALMRQRDAAAAALERRLRRRAAAGADDDAAEPQTPA